VNCYIKGGYDAQKPKRLFITALFGSIIFVVNVFLPPPINYVLIVVQAVLLALSGLFIKAGASYVGAVGGLLTALGSPALGPFTFLFSFLFGVLVDGFLFIFRIPASPERVNRNRLMAAMAFSTMLIGLISYSAFALFPQFIPLAKEFSSVGLFIQRSTMLDALVLFMGPATGIVAGYAAAYLWNKYLRNIRI
jgi:cytochrome b subunit of formate dehydrogenase